MNAYEDANRSPRDAKGTSIGNSAAVCPIDVRTKFEYEKLLLGAGFQPKAEGHDASAQERGDGGFGDSCRQQSYYQPGINRMACKCVRTRVNKRMMLLASDYS